LTRPVRRSALSVEGCAAYIAGMIKADAKTGTDLRGIAGLVNTSAADPLPRKIKPSLELFSVSLDVPTDKGSDAALANNRGVRLATEGSLDAALACYDEAIRLNPQLAAAHNNRANTYLRLGRIGDAIASYREASRLAPEVSLYHYNFGSALLDAEDFETAREQLQIAVSSGPKHAATYLNLGLAFSGLGRYEEAIEAYDEAVRLDPTNLSALAGRAIALSSLGRFEEAAEAHRTAIEALQQALRADDPAYIQVYRYLAEALANLGKWDEAREIVDEWQQLAQAEADPYYAQGLIADHFGYYDQAIEAYKNALQHAPDFYDALARLGGDLVRLGRPAEAIEPLKKAIQLDPAKALAYLNEGLAEKNLGRFSDAVLNFRQAIHLGMDSADTYAELGYALYHCGELAESISAYAKAEEQDSSDPAIPENIGLIFALGDQPQEAASAFRRALALDQNRDRSRRGLCKALIDTNDITAAAAVLREIERFQGSSGAGKASIDGLPAGSQAERPVIDPQKAGDRVTRDNEAAVSEDTSYYDPARLAGQLFRQMRDPAAPVNVAAIATAFNVGISLRDFADAKKTTSRLVRLPDNRYHIYLASELRTPWKRVFLARQLYFALAKQASEKSGELTNAVLNAAAEQFAQEILMPPDLVARYWQTLKSSEAMAAAFDVPQELMNVRLVKLGLDQESREDEHGKRPTEIAVGRKRNFGGGSRNLAP
jgi:tetratricopeptide (TPR) repeat protein